MRVFGDFSGLGGSLTILADPLMLVLGASGLLCLPACSLGPQKCYFLSIFTDKYHFWVKCRHLTDSRGRWWCSGALWWCSLGWVMCSGAGAVCWWVFALVLDHPVTLGVETGRETPIFIGRSRPFSLSGALGVGDGWSCGGATCALGDGLQCGTQ